LEELTVNDVRRKAQVEKLKRAWYSYSRNKLSVVGLGIVIVILIAGFIGPLVAPYPEHAGAFVDFASANQPPSLKHLFGTDNIGRDIFSRILFALRSALIMSGIVLGIAVPIGTVLGIVAGYMKGTAVEIIIMRITDIFLSIPAMILAMAIASLLEPNLRNAMLAVTVMWWPWYCRLVYSVSRSLRNEYYVIAAELTGARMGHIMFREMLPNCLGPILTKMTLDVGWVIMIGASMSFVGLGEQAPIPSLGGMVADGSKYMPELWWMTVFPALVIMFIVLPFNLLGDGVRDLVARGEER
jgi:peptide/nickel transport system permease protein